MSKASFVPIGVKLLVAVSTLSLLLCSHSCRGQAEFRISLYMQLSYEFACQRPAVLTQLCMHRGARSYSSRDARRARGAGHPYLPGCMCRCDVRAYRCLTRPGAEPLELISTLNSASTAALLSAGAARQKDILAIDLDLWPYIVDIRIQEAANKDRHWRIVMGDHIEVQVLGSFGGVLLWEPSLESSKVVI